MDGKHFSLITIAMIILLGIVGLGFMQMKTQSSINQVMTRLEAVESKTATPTQAPVVTTTTTTSTTTPKVALKAYSGELSFDYPAGFQVVEVNGAVKGSKNIRVTSEPGTLFIQGGGPEKQEPGQFTNGLQIDVSEFVEPHFSGEEKFQETGNPMVKRLVAECDGVGCPSDEYYVTKGNKTYIMTVQVGGGYSIAPAELNTIIYSMK